MSITDDNNVEIDCYYCGRRQRLPLLEAIKLFHTSSYAWLLPLDYYRWAIGDRAGDTYVYEHVSKSARSFGRRIHTHRMRALSLRGLEALEDAEIDARTFHKRASRFNSIFDGLPADLRPFVYDEIETIDDVRIPAYRMRQSRTWLVVVGAADGQDDRVEWAMFLDPPPSSDQE